MTSATVSVRQQFAQTMLRIGMLDARLVVLVCDISHGALQPFAKACPGRYFNLGILEGASMSVAAGLARSGLVPVIHTIAPFLVERAFEQIKLDFGYQKLAGNIVTIGSAFDFSGAGCTHHCYGDFAMIKTIPGAQIAYPASALEFDGLFGQSYDNDAITLFRISAHSHGVDFEPRAVRFGSGIRVAEGRTLSLIATGPQLRTALNAKAMLDTRGWNTEVIYIHTIRPLDRDLVVSTALKTRRVVVIEEHAPYGGLADDVLRIVSHLDGVRLLSISLPEAFVAGYGSYEEQCERYGLTANGVVERISSEFAQVVRRVHS